MRFLAISGSLRAASFNSGLLRHAQAVATEGVGKDVTLTGRTEIWEVALAAIEHRPVLGWSYDSHQSVFDDPSYTVPYTQYHNGFLDTLVAGGAVLMLVLGVHVRAFLGRVRRVAATGALVYPLAFGLVVDHAAGANIPKRCACAANLTGRGGHLLQIGIASVDAGNLGRGQLQLLIQHKPRTAQKPVFQRRVQRGEQLIGGEDRRIGQPVEQR